MTSNSKDFYQILVNERQKLGDFLINDFHYDVLKKMLIEIQLENKDQISIIKKLFLGHCGFEHNKQTGFYELPTFELLTIIEVICEYYGIKKIEDLASGSGLLPFLMTNFFDNTYQISASDGKRWIETSTNIFFDNLLKKELLEYTLNVTLENDKLFIISWIPGNDFRDLEYFISKKKPKYFIIIGNIIHDIKKKKIFDSLRNYKFFGLSAKQICYLDYFVLNEKILNFEKSHSNFFFFTTDDTRNLDQLSLSLVINHNNCLFSKGKNNSLDPYQIIYDLVYNQVIPPKIINFLNDSNLECMISYILNTIKKKFIIPLFIDNFDDFKFWYDNAISNNRIIFESYEKFKEYQYLFNKIRLQENFNELKNQKVFPEWLTFGDCQKFLFLEFSSRNKKWKSSRAMFNSTYSSFLEAPLM